MITIPTTFAEVVSTPFGTFKSPKAFNQNTRWGVEKLSSGFDGDTNTKALCFAPTVTLFYQVVEPALDVSEVWITTANDRPERNPSQLEFHYKDGTVLNTTAPDTTEQFHKLVVPVAFNTRDLVAVKLTAKSGSIVQFAEFKFVGAEDGTVPTPDPDPDPDPTPDPTPDPEPTPTKEIDFITVVYTDNTTEDFVLDV